MSRLRVVSQLILNVYVKVTILLTLNRSRRIISCVLIGVLFTCALLGLSSAPIYAASEEDPLSSSEVPSLVIPEEYKDPVYAKLSEGVRATYTVSDVYVLLNSALVGESNSSTYSLPRIAYYTWQTYSRLGTTNTRLYDILSALVDGNSTNIPVGPGIRQMLYGLDSQNQDFETIFDTSQDTRDLAQLIYASTQQIHGDGQNNSYYLSQIASSLSDNYNWQSTTSTYLGTSTGWNTSYISSTTNAASLKVGLSITGVSVNTPCLLRIYVPVYPTSSYVNSAGVKINAVKRYYNNAFADVPMDWDYFLEPTNNGTFIYIFGYRYSWQNVFFEFTSSTSGNVTYNVSTTPTVTYIPFNTSDFQELKTAFYTAKTGNSISSLSDSAKALSDYLVSPEKQAAEDASQAVIDDTLDGFTGSGSAAAKTSDTGGMKNMSGSIQSGLDTGASASNAASVFSNTTFWSWFTQDNANKINQPYPAPVVPQTRGSGDEIVDFLSGNQAELNELLNQRNSW